MDEGNQPDKPSQETPAPTQARPRSHLNPGTIGGRKSSMSASMAAMAAMLGGGRLFPVRELKPKRKCALPGCNESEDRGRGYCSAAHYHEHRKRNKTYGKSKQVD